MNGSVRKRGNSWYYRMDLAYINGERKQIERFGGKTKEEAQNALRDAIKEYQTTGDVLSLSDISVIDYYEYWFNNYVKINLKKNTQKNYRGILDNHIYPYIGNYKLKSVKPGKLQELLNEEFNKGFSKQTLSIIKGVLNKGFQMAIYPYGYLHQDPTRYIKIPKYDLKEWKDKGDLKIISMEDFKLLSSAVSPSDPYYLPMMISFQTGLRRAEVCGLMWKDIDFEDETLRVERIMIQDGKDFTLGTPKTKASYRTILLGDTLLKILKMMKKRQKENKLFYGSKYIDSDFVCVKENGQPVTPNSIKWYTAKLRKQTKVNFNFHSFRHTHATMLLEQGAKPKEIQARLGHSRLATTMDTYAHVTKKMKKDTIDIFEKMLRDNVF
ncbi:tyrosine-type recombinase/integrase [Enterococcus faecium]|uniref:tyrosine-type recombinase/integrase n=2 Tax=Bacilli TaxID=91061 RepID=UPI0018ABB7B7|nr:tyrosine-type recombinase/integrase [Enterococcus faecium]